MLIARQVAKVKSINGPSAMPDWDFAQALKEPLDVLMVPGGGGIWPLLDDEADPKGVAALLDWMQGGAPLIGDRNAGLVRIFWVRRTRDAGSTVQRGEPTSCWARLNTRRSSAHGHGCS